MSDPYLAIYPGDFRPVSERKEKLLKVYPELWLSDPISKCSLAAQGFWIRLAMISSQATERFWSRSENKLQIHSSCLRRILGLFAAEESLMAALLVELESVGACRFRSSESGYLEITILRGPVFKLFRKRKYPHGWRVLRRFILTRDSNVCSYCGSKATTVDHVNPVSRGGNHEEGNLAAACKSCNSRKKDRPVVEFLSSLTGGIPNV